MRYGTLGIVISLLLLTSVVGWGEGVWQVVNPPTMPGKQLYFHDVCFVDPEHGWAVARASDESGRIFRRDDDGVWRSLFNISGFCPEALQFLTHEKGWVAGWGKIGDGETEGILLSSEDGGKSWVERHRFPWEIHHMQFVNEEKGWIVGSTVDAEDIPTSVVLATHDGGESWEVQYEKENAVLIDDFCLVDANNGWVLGSFREHEKLEQILLHTTNGGKNWEHLSIEQKFLLSVDFTDANQGWAVGKEILPDGRYDSDETIFHTQDGGQTWTRQRTVTEKHSSWPYSVMHFVDERTGCVILGSAILHTGDGGNTWTFHQEYVSRGGGKVATLSPEAMYFCNREQGWLVGNAILATTDGGASWVQEPYGVPDQDLNETFQDLCAVFFVTARDGWITGRDGIIFHTDDSGITWEMQESSTMVELLGAHFISPQEGWVVGDKGTILHTTDGGSTWKKQRSGTEFPLRDVQFVNTQEGWIAGSEYITVNDGQRHKGIVLHTVDGGEKWEIVRNLPDLHFLEDVYFLDPDTGWISGTGILLYTEDGGKSWQDRRDPQHRACGSVWFLDTLVGWATSDSSILHTVDGGFKWEEQYNGRADGSITRLRTIHFANHNEGWAFGWQGHPLLHTSNGGQAWVSEGLPLEDPPEFHSICYGGSNTLWLVGDFGTVLKYTDPDLDAIRPTYWAVESSDKSITTWGNVRNQLFQNYPNPFNPETWIPYQLNSDAGVVFRIYSIDGKLIRTLDLGYKQAGSYTDKSRAAYWDGRNEAGESVASGSYFYQLIADGFSGIKKMLVVR